MSPHPLVALEDALAEELVLASLGAADPPRVDGRYEIVALLGRGARGLVCRAIDVRLDREVALKLYPPVEAPRWVDELAREGKALARLDHPHVVRVFDVATGSLVRGTETTPVHFLSMELVVGRSLRVLANEPSFGRDARLRLLEEVAEALDAAHSVGVVHRDVKPENVVVDARMRARVVDFGLARVSASEVTADVPGADGGATLYGRLVGTPEYMAYEARDGRVGPAADQFSLAVMAFELLTGRMPYDDGQRPIEAPDVPLPASDRTVPDGLSRAAFARALARDPDARFPSSAAFVAALRGAACASAGAPPEAAAAAPRRPRRALALGVGAGLAALGLAAFAARPDPPTPGPALDVRPAVGSTPTPAPADAGTDPDVGRASGPSPCASALGSWDLRATVDASRLRSTPAGFRAYFRLHLAGDGDCDVMAHLQKLGDDAVLGDAGPLHVEPDMIRDDRARVSLQPDGATVVLDETFALASRTRGRRDYHLTLRLVEGRFTGRIAYLGPNGQPVHESVVETVSTPDGGVFGFPLERDLGLPSDVGLPTPTPPSTPLEPSDASLGTSPENLP